MSAMNPGDGAGWFWICVDSVTDGIACGTLQNQFLPSTVKFCGLDHIVQIGEEIMDEINFPQGFFCLRRFGKMKEESKRDGPPLHDCRLSKEKTCHPIETRYGKWATFNVQVLFRKNASWQGRATLYENPGSHVLHFRSAIELTLAMRVTLAEIKSVKEFSDSCRAMAQGI